MISDKSEAVVHECRSVAETEALASAWAEQLGSGSWVGLIGPLGAGKSVFARAIGRAFGVTAVMPSPSYTLMVSHEGRCPVHHIDLYRVESREELDFAGVTPYFSGTGSGSGICLVEWADRVREIWPSSGWIVEIEVTGAESRRITITPITEGSERPQESN